MVRCFISTLFALLAIFFMIIGSADASDSNGSIFRIIDNMHLDGKITLDEAALYKIYAMVKPELLPEPLKSVEYKPLYCGTSIVLDVLSTKDLISPNVYACIIELLAPREDDEFVIDSTIYPIRVHCPVEYGEDYCSRVVFYAESAWEKEVDGLGFYPPPPDDGYGGNDNLDFFIMEHSFVGGYMTPIGIDLTKEWLSMSSFIVLSPLIKSEKGLEGLIAHEFNHSCQFAMDPLEWMLLESTASFIATMLTYDNLSRESSIQVFQKYPEKSIDYVFLSADISEFEFGYHYGASLFLGFLDEYYGYKNMIFIREIWENSRQKELINEPDYIDALEIMLPGINGDCFSDAYREFAKWRWFLGQNDDGAHFENGKDFSYSSKVRLEKTVSTSDIPLQSFTPENPPSEYGSNYIDFNLNGEKGTLFISFEGDQDKKWSADMILIPEAGSPTEYVECVESGDSTGILFLPDIGEFEKTAFVITNLSDGDHDPDKFEWEPSDYILDADIITTPKVQIKTDKKEYVTGDSLEAGIIMINPGEKAELDLVVLLAIDGNFLYYPEFTKTFAKVSKALDEKSSKYEAIVNVPRIDESISGEYNFYAAMLDPLSGEIRTGISKSVFTINKKEPTAIFDVNPEQGGTYTTFFVDAQYSYDLQDSVDDLKFRWDWEDDGLWDAPYSSLRKRTHKYSRVGMKTIRLEVMDTEGFTDQTTRTIEIID